MYALGKMGYSVKKKIRGVALTKKMTRFPLNMRSKILVGINHSRTDRAADVISYGGLNFQSDIRRNTDPFLAGEITDGSFRYG